MIGDFLKIKYAIQQYWAIPGSLKSKPSHLALCQLPAASVKTPLKKLSGDAYKTKTGSHKFPRDASGISIPKFQVAFDR